MGVLHTPVVICENEFGREHGRMQYAPTTLPSSHIPYLHHELGIGTKAIPAMQEVLNSPFSILNSALRVIIYTSTSFGGCYDYAGQLHRAYLAHPQVESCKMVYPMNAPALIRTDVLPVLMPDTPSEATSQRGRRLHFLRRTARNPLTFLKLLQREPASLVIFNDFDQVTAPLWAPMYRALARQHRYAAILHDPDRDNYPPSKSVSERCMKALMGLMDLGLYHQHLPDKPYYQSKRTLYVDVPHGLYPPPAADMELEEQVAAQKKPGLTYAAILGNIRAEKNYGLALEAMARFPKMGLIIAGKPSHQGVRTEDFKARAEELGVAERVIWVERFMTEAEMAAVIDAADLILLYYAKSFTSQSGILNTVAPLHKTIVASDGESSLAQTIRRFNIGLLAAPDSLDDLCRALARAFDGFGPDASDWGLYLEYASWQNHTETVLKSLQETIPQHTWAGWDV